MTTALELITRSAKLLGVVFKGEALSADEAVDGLDALNDMLDGWSNDSLVIPYYVTESFALTANDGTYTIGTGLNFNTTAPLEIVSAYVRSNDTDYEVKLISEREYNIISQKSQNATYPEVLTYDNNGTINLWPLPGSGLTLFLTSEKPLSNIAALSTTLSLPKGYERAIRYNLAIELAPEYGVETPREVAVVATKSLAGIKRQVNRKRPIKILKERLTRNYDGLAI